jgi:uncharacterized membrane protein YcaP (DUF421 family)
MFTFTVSPLELMIRGTLIYLLLFLLFRFVARRDAGSLSVSDLLVLVIIADAAQNAMAGEYKSVVDGAVLICTIIGWSVLLNFLSYRSKTIRRFVVPSPICLVKDGIKQRKNLRRELITDDELYEMLREHEVEDLSEVKLAYLEPDGAITVMKKEGTKNQGSTLPHERPEA